MSGNAGCSVGGVCAAGDKQNQTRSLRPNPGWTGARGVVVRVPVDTWGGEGEEPNVSVVSFPFPLYCSYFLGRKWGWFAKGVRDVVRALEGKVSASRIVRIDLRMLSWIAARQRIRSSQKAVGVYSR